MSDTELLAIVCGLGFVGLFMGLGIEFHRLGKRMDHLEQELKQTRLRK